MVSKLLYTLLGKQNGIFSQTYSRFIFVTIYTLFIILAEDYN